MAQSNGTPATRHLFALPAVTGAGSDDPVIEPVAVTGPAALPVQPSSATGGTAGPATGSGAVIAAAPLPVPMAIRERARLATRQRLTSVAGSTREIWLPYARTLQMLWQPESMAGHRAYIKSRAWVPEGLDGSARKAVVFFGVAYHLLVARPLKAAAKIIGGAAKAIDASADRPLRLSGLIAFILVFAIAVLPHIPL